MGHIGIIDWQHLNHTLVGLVCPVNHHFQIAEVAHTKTPLTAQRENRNHRTGTFPWINGEISLRQFIDHHLIGTDGRQVNAAVGILFPNGREILFAITDDKLELKVLWQLCGIQADYPFVVFMFRHIDGTLGVPGS